MSNKLITPAYLIEKLNNGEATFAYKMQDDTIRAAHGTRNIKVVLKAADRLGRQLSEIDMSESVKLQCQNYRVKYFDLDRWTWLSFDPYRLLTTVE